MPQTTLRIAVRKFGPFESAVQRQFDAFRAVERMHDLDLQMDVLEVGPLDQALFAGRGLADGTYDLAFVVTDWLAAAVHGGLLLDLAPLLSRDPPPDFPGNWCSSLLKLQQVGEGTYALPYHDGPECLIYRADLIDKPPATWDRFHALARNLTNEERYGTVIAAYPEGHNTVYDFCLHLWTRGGELLDPASGAPDLATPQAVAALDFYRTLAADASACWPDARGVDSIRAGNLFMSGKVAMMANWFGFAAMCQTLPDSQVRDKVSLAPLPAGAGGRSCSLNVYWTIGIAAGSRQPQLAYRFLRHMLRPEMDKLLTLGGAVGCRLSTWLDDEVNAVAPFFRLLPQLHENARSFPVDRRMPGLIHAIDDAVTAALTTAEPTESILRRADDRARRAWNGGAA